MEFHKGHRREPTEPQLATMIDVFSILIIFLIAGTAMDSSVLNIPADLFMPDTLSKSTSVNAPQITLKDGILLVNFVNEKVTVKEIEGPSNLTPKIASLNLKLRKYLEKITENNKKKAGDLQLLQSLNLVADKDTPYSQIFTTMKYFRELGFQNTILVGVEGNGKEK